MSKHTPGPWVVRPKRYLDTRRRVGPADNEFFDVAYSSGNSNAESESNARLIAAAPEMLDVLKALVDRCNHLGSTDQVTGEVFYDMVRAAIAKAEGRE